MPSFIMHVPSRTRYASHPIALEDLRENFEEQQSVDSAIMAVPRTNRLTNSEVSVDHHSLVDLSDGISIALEADNQASWHGRLALL